MCKDYAHPSMIFQPSVQSEPAAVTAQLPPSASCAYSTDAAASAADTNATVAKRKSCDADSTSDARDCDQYSCVSTAAGSVYSSSDETQCEWADNNAAEQPNTDKPASKGRKTATKGACKSQRMCMYEHCPSPMHSSKWRVVTSTTVAGGRDWQSLFGMTLCDSCYSTYRKHGTFIRSVRTPEGWARFDHSAQTHVLNKPCKKRVTSAPRPVKRARPALFVRCTLPVSEDAGRPKRERKPSSKLRHVLGQDDEAEAQTPETCKQESREHDWSQVSVPHPLPAFQQALEPSFEKPFYNSFNYAIEEEQEEEIDVFTPESSASLTEDYELDYFYQHPESADVVDGATSYLAARAFDPFEVMV